MSVLELALLLGVCLLAVRLWIDHRDNERQARAAADYRRRAEEEHRLRLRRLRLECLEIRLKIRRDERGFN